MTQAIRDARLTGIRDRVEAGERLSFDDGLYLYEQADLALDTARRSVPELADRIAATLRR